MLQKFAEDISSLLTTHVSLDTVSIKTGGVICEDIQKTIVKSANAIYEVIEKKASEEDPSSSENHVKVTTLVTKLASLLNKPSIDKEMLLKIAAAVVTDDALKTTLNDVTDPIERNKIAEVQSFGREFVCSMLYEVL